MKYTLDSTLGELFVISTGVDAPFAPDARIGVTLASYGIVVIPRTPPR